MSCPDLPLDKLVYHFFFGDQMCRSVEQPHECVDVVRPFIEDSIRFFVLAEVYYATRPINPGKHSLGHDEIWQELLTLL